MNKIYDFEQIEEIRAEQKKLIFRYVFFVLCFIVAVAISCIVVKNNILLTVIFAFLLLCLIIVSILLWKIKYGILNEYKKFLDNMETGKRTDYVGEFEGKIECSGEEESFDSYIFVYLGKKTSFYIHKQCEVDFAKGKKYHIECIGSYICQWEIID